MASNITKPKKTVSYYQKNKKRLRAYNKLYMKKYRIKHKERLEKYDKLYSRAYNIKNKEKVKAYRLKNKKKISERNKQYRLKYRDIIVAKERAYAKRLKSLIMGKYGGECVACGEKDVDVLTIDHILCNGQVDRKFGAGKGFYRMLLKTPLRKDLQILCFSCQWRKNIYGPDISTWFKNKPTTSFGEDEPIGVSNKNMKEYHKVIRLRLKAKAMRRYGGCCANCKTNELAILTIDHIYGGGQREREKISSGCRDHEDPILIPTPSSFFPSTKVYARFETVEV